MTALTPENCCRHMMVAQRIVGPRREVLDNSSRRGSWPSDEDEDGESGRRGASAGISYPRDTIRSMGEQRET